VIRYYVIATAIVVIVGSVVFAHRLAPPNVRISAQPSGTPTVDTHVAEAPPMARPFSAQGPWVLSALPDCFEEQARLSGPPAALDAKLPPAGDRIAPGTILHVAGCTVLVRPRDVWVDRGPDRLRVPPDAALYRVDGRLVLTVRTGTELEIRRY